MKKIFISLIIFALPLSLFAQEINILTLGTVTVSYNETVEEGDTTFYYDDDALVMSEHEGGISIVYENDLAILEAHDTDLDGEPDIFLVLDNNENIKNLSGEGASQFEREEAKTFEELIQASEAGEGGDLVGDLSDIKIPGTSGNTLIFVLFLAGLVGGYVVWNKRKTQEEPKT